VIDHPERSLENSHGRWMAWLEGGLLALAAPFLLFPGRWPAVTCGMLAALGLIWLLSWFLGRNSWPVTPFNSALLLFALMVAVGIVITPLPELTLPKATGLILGLAVFRFIGLWANSRRWLIAMLFLFCLVGLGILMVGLLGSNWGAKIPSLQPLVARLPRLAVELPDAPDAGISPNQLAGALIVYLPLAVLSVFGWCPKGRLVWLWLLALANLLLLGGVLILTQSRGGWLGGVSGVLALVALTGFSAARRWAGWSAVIIIATITAVGIGSVLLLDGGQDAHETQFAGDTQGALEDAIGAISIEGRIEVWNRALYAIADFPFTGSGLGTFREVVRILYPPFRVPTTLDIAHAHNIFVQTALDVGLPGLVAYLALLGIAGAASWKVAQCGDFLTHRVALGLAAGLVGLHVYGLTDALALGSKPGLVFWMALGLIAAMTGARPRQESASL
jgi:putative inorganic carbon (HCO3(-)) transporter